MTFTPHIAGSYEAVLQVWAQLEVGGEGDGRKASSLTSRVILKALAEEPKLEVSPACPLLGRSQHLGLETLCTFRRCQQVAVVLLCWTMGCW